MEKAFHEAGSGAPSPSLNTAGPIWPGLRCRVILLLDVGPDFNITHFIRSRCQGYICVQNPTLKMTSTRIELSFNKIGRLTDLADLAEMLFPGNRNQQHAFLAIWITLKWADRHMVPNLGSVGREHGISRRTMERVRAKMRRMGLIDHVSRFNARHGYREGWVLSTRFERGLTQLAGKMADLRDPGIGSKDKDVLLLEFAEARRRAAGRRDDNRQEHGGDTHVQTVFPESGNSNVE
jgi:hypothetical protein